MPELVTHIATATNDKVTVRGKDLVNELVGEHSFTAMLYFLITNRFPTPGQCRVLDACLVMLMEHGFTPSALVARLLAESVPDELQVALGAGVMTIGGVHAGTMDGCGAILAAGVNNSDPIAYCREVVQSHKTRKQAVPGFGHRFHKPDDPRTPRLLAIAAQEGVSGQYVALLQLLGKAVDEASGRHITINVTGAIAALLLEIGIPAGINRGIAVVSRSGGLLGHILEEQRTNSARILAKMASEGIPYRDPDASPP